MISDFSSLQDFTQLKKNQNRRLLISFFKLKITILTSGFGPPSMLLIRLFQPFPEFLSSAVFWNRSTPNEDFLIWKKPPFISVEGTTSLGADTILQHLTNRSCYFLSSPFWYIFQNSAKNTVYTYPSSC